MGGTAAWFHAAATQTLPEEVNETPDVLFTQKHVPLGVGAAIVSFSDYYVGKTLSFGV